MQKRIVLLDTHAIIHRAYHALPDFRASDGTPTGALYGLCNMVSSIIRELKPDYIFACYDLPGKTFRHDAYEDYKGTRKKGDDDLITQLISSRELMESLSIPIYDAPGYEADDVIGTISKQFGKKDTYDVIIASGDMDTLQLIEDKHIRVFTLKKGITDTVLLDEDAVVERFGFEPIYIQDYKALRGDASDNIPGVPGVGEKTATILIQKYKTIENLYKVLSKKEDEVKSLPGITERIIRILKENEEGAVFSKMLASIRTDAPIKVKLPENHWNESFDKEKAETCFKKYEFRTVMARFDPNYVKPEKNTISKNTKPKKETTVEKGVKKQNTTDLFSVPVDETKLEEAKLMVWLLNSEKTNPDLNMILDSAGLDDFDSAHEEILRRLKKEPKLFWLYNNMDRPLIEIVALMKKRGMKMDREYLNILSTNIRNELAVLEKDIIKIAGEEFNLNSPKQLSQILFEKLALPTKGLKKRKDGLYSTDVDTLNKFVDVHPIINKMLEYRELEKLRSTYIDAWIELLDKNNELHPTFILTGAATGRFASQNPGVQNIPVRGSRGMELRRAFIARPDYSLVAFDYSQIELRALAILSQDPSLINVFKQGNDIHAEVASRVYGVPPNEITKDMRRHAKVINFGVLYGMGSTALAKEMGVSRNEAKDFIDKYFSQFPRVAMYLESVLADARKNGYTETLYGRRRYIPNIKSNIPFLRSMAERMAGNAPIQGTATADLIRNALVNIHNMFVEKNYQDKAYIILQIHDELVFEIHDSVLEKVSQDIKEIMEKPIDKMFIKDLETVPILVEKHVGKNWGDMV
jgi:DNA polymerase-1